jgi:molybdate transport system substrate-binding protein
MIRTALLLVLMVIVPRGATASPVRVMVAANFRECLQVLTEQYTARTGVEFKISHGGTGQLYAQIRAGAPCDLFFAADSARPQKLVAEGLAAAADCNPYAIGMLVLVSQRVLPSPGGHQAVELVLDQVVGDEGARLAIANPELAPYGKAAVQLLQNIERFEAWENRLVRGQNVGQTWQFVYTGAASLGLVARSQIMAARRTGQDLKLGTTVIVPWELYDPIIQQVVVLQNAQPASRDFLTYLFSPEGSKVLFDFGYRIPTP